jgi:hypothetical protein
MQTISQLEQHVKAKSKKPKRKQLSNVNDYQILIIPCVRHQNGDTSVSSRFNRVSNHKSETGIRSTKESTIAKVIVKMDTDCLLRSVRINTQIVRIFPSNPTAIIIGVK